MEPQLNALPVLFIIFVRLGLDESFFKNAELPILVTLLGIVTLVSLLKQNAVFPIDTTCLPFILLGITTSSPPSILYPVIDIPPSTSS